MLIINKHGKIVKRSRSTFKRRLIKAKHDYIQKTINESEENIDEAPIGIESENPCEIVSALRYIDRDDFNTGLYIKTSSESDHDYCAKPKNDTNENTRDKSSENKKHSLSDELRYWAVNHRITARAINDLLKILILYGLTFLPRDRRALLKTPRKVTITEMQNGKYWYNGIVTCLSSTFRNLNQNINIELNLNMDGLPINNSTKANFWPILASIHSAYNIHLNSFSFECIQFSSHIIFIICRYAKYKAFNYFYLVR